MRNKGTFILGVGAHKSGTTWLHAYLAAQPQFNGGLMKEYHVWDARALPGCDRFRVAQDAPDTPRNRLRKRMQDSPAAYFRYFANRLAQPGITHSGDITPAYSALPPRVFARIHRGFQRREVACKAVFLMRDPVDRCWSAVRARMGREGQTSGAEEMLMDYVRTPSARMRTRYQVTIENLHAALPAEDILITSYEGLFRSDGLKAISGVLDVPHDPGLLSVSHNDSPRHHDLSDEMRARVAAVFHDTYIYCGNHFPHLRSLWSGFDFL